MTRGTWLARDNFQQSLISQLHFCLDRIGRSRPLPSDGFVAWNLATALGQADRVKSNNPSLFEQEIVQCSAIKRPLRGAILLASLRTNDAEVGADILDRSLRLGHKRSRHLPVTPRNAEMQLKELLNTSGERQADVLWRRAAALSLRWIENSNTANELARLAFHRDSMTVRLSAMSSLRARGEISGAMPLKEELSRLLNSRHRMPELMQGLLHALCRLDADQGAEMCRQVLRHCSGSCANSFGAVEMRGRALTLLAVLMRREGCSFSDTVSDLLAFTSHREPAINIANLIVAAAGLPAHDWTAPDNALLNCPLRAPLWYGAVDW
jgi:hypothetical protein